MAYATATDIEDRLGRSLDASETTIVETRLTDAYELIKTRIPDLDLRIDEGDINERLVVMVLADVVLRLIRNPDGYTEEVDGNYSYKIDSDVASGRLRILPEEWAMLGLSRSVVVIAPKIIIPTGAYGVSNPNHCFEQGQEWADTAVWG